MLEKALFKKNSINKWNRELRTSVYSHSEVIWKQAAWGKFSLNKAGFESLLEPTEKNIQGKSNYAQKKKLRN